MKHILTLGMLLVSSALFAEVEYKKSPALIQRALEQSTQEIMNSHQWSFCESYEDFEDCPPRDSGPDSTDDGDGGRTGDGSGPDDIGDGF